MLTFSSPRVPAQQLPPWQDSRIPRELSPRTEQAAKNAPCGTAHPRRRTARVNGELARQNKQIGPRDALIAGTALEWDLSLLTLNLVEFQRVPGLRLVSPA